MYGMNWTDIATDEDRQRLSGGGFGGEGTRYYDGGRYMTVQGNAGQAGWGDLVPPGYGKVGYTLPQAKYYGHKMGMAGSIRSVTPGTLFLRRLNDPAPQQQQQAPAAAPPPTVEAPKELPVATSEEPKGPSMADIAAQFSSQIQAMQQGFMQSMQQQTAQFQQMQAAQQERMAALQQQMLQAQVQQQDRPEVAGVKTATGSAGTAMQIARRGVTGAFGRRGMRISSLNV